MKKHICFLAAAFIVFTEVVSGQDFIFRFVNYNRGDTAFLQFGPEYRSPRYPVVVSEGRCKLQERLNCRYLYSPEFTSRAITELPL
jgi:hypothetical protein